MHHHLLANDGAAKDEKYFSTEFNSHMELKFGYSEKATKFEKISNLKFDVTQYCQILSGIIFLILWPSQNIRTLT